MKRIEWRRIVSGLLAIVLVLSNVPITALATDDTADLCVHHEVHTDCGYEDGVSACGYVCEICNAEPEATSTETQAPSEPEPTVVETQAPTEPEETEAATEAPTEPEATEEPTQPACTGLADCAAENHEDTCEKKLAEEKAAADQAAADAVSALIEALPELEAVMAKPRTEQNADYEQVMAAYEAYCALTAEQQALLPLAEEVFEPYLAYFATFTKETDLIDEGTCGEKVTWTLDADGTLTISGTGAMEDYEYGSPWYNSRDDIKKVIIQDGVTSIGKNAFLGCNILKSVVIPSSVTTIGYQAFSSCSSLTSVKIPEGVTSIGSYAFSGCNRLTSVEIPSSVTSISYHAFSGCSSLTSIVIPSSVTSIGSYAFYGCSGLTSVVIPAGVTSIDSYAFDGCSSLTSVVIPGSVSNIGSYAFGYCSSLTSIVIPSSVTSIDSYAFDGCSSLTSVVIPGSVSNIGSSTFEDCSNLTSVIISEGVTSIGSYAFSGCYRLTSVEIPSSVTSISTYAFENCTSLKSIYLPASVRTISGGDYISCPFMGCSSSLKIYCGATSKPSSWDSHWNYYDSSSDATLSVQYGWTKADYDYWSHVSLDIEELVIPDTVTSIPTNALKDFDNLKSVVIPSSVTSIGSNAFKNCTGLTKIYIPASVATISASGYSYSPFYGCSSSLKIYCEAASQQTGWDAYWNYCDINSILSVQYGWTEEDYDYWAKLSPDIEELVIPDTVTSIPSNALENFNNLKSVTIPSSVTSIGASAFSGCSSLTDIYIEDVAAWLNLGLGSSNANPLRANSLEKKLYLNGELVTDLVIPSSVTAIGQYAFYNCSGLKSIYIPSSVTIISASSYSYSPFYGCSSSLKIYCEAASPQTGWDAYWNYCGYNSTLSVQYGWTKENHDIWARLSPDIEELVIPDTVTSIPSNALENFNNLKSVTIPSSVTSIGASAFSGCSSLTSVVIPESVSNIGEWAFYNCSSLTSVVIPSSVTSIGNYAFYGCSSLTSVVIPSSVTSIGEAAFSNCAALTDIYYSADMEQWAALTNKPSVAYVHYSCTQPINHWATTEVDTTCETNGYTYEQCDCGYERNIVITEEAWGHTEVIDEAVSPTCTETGLTEGKHCSVCSEVLVEQTVVDALGHYVDQSDPEWVDSYTAQNDASYPFTVSSGWYTSTNKSHSSTSTYQIKAVYDCTLVLSYKVSSEANYDKLSVSVNSTVKDTISGTVSEKSMTLSLKARDIVYIKYSKDGSASTGSDAGYFKIVSCTQTNIGGLGRIPADELEPTCEESIVCDSCKQVIKPMLGHTEVIDAYVASTCTDTGLTEGKHCATCGKVLVEQTVIAVKHNYIDSVCTICQAPQGISYSVSNGTVTITGYTTPSGFTGALEIPATIMGMPVTSIGDSAFSGCSCLTSVTIPDSVTSIGSSAFYGCTGLTHIYIPASVSSISGSNYRYSPFYNCSTSLRIYCGAASKPSGWSSYWNCYYYYDNNGWSETRKDFYVSFNMTRADYNFWTSLQSDIEELVIPDTVTSIPSMACYNFTKLKSVVIPSSVTSIGNSAFYKCSALTSVVIPEGVTSIGSSAFSGCSSLTSVEISEGVTSIGNSAFDGCSSLTSIAIPSSVTSIGSYAFYGCSSLTSIAIPSSVTSIGSGVFVNCSGLTSVVIPEGVTSIGDSAFGNCTNLTKIYIPSSVTTISASSYSDSPFYGCSSDLVIYCEATSKPSGWGYYWNYYSSGSALTVKYGLTRAEYDFWVVLDSNIESIMIPDTLTSIPRNILKDFSKLKSVYIPASVTTISASSYSDSPFYGCSSDLVICCEATSKQSGWGSYWNYYGSDSSLSVKYGWTKAAYEFFADLNSDITELVIPDTVTLIPSNALKYFTKLKKVYIPASVTTISASSYSNSPFYGCSSDLVIYCEATSKQSGWGSYWNYYGSSSSLSVKYGWTKAEYDFWSNVSPDIEELVIPETVTSIPKEACYDFKNLTSVIIPSSVTSIGISAFSGCSNLTSVEISEGVTSIGNSAFYECSALTSVVIPEGVTSIGSSAFSGCSSLTSIAIPSSVTSIGSGVFANCSSLTSVEIPEGATSIASSAFDGCSSLTCIVIPEGVVSIGTNAFYGCTSLKNIYIPVSVTTISANGNSSSPFYGCSSNLVIYCEATSKPSGWESYWNYYGSYNGYTLTVRYGCTKEAYDFWANLNPDVEELVIPDAVTSIPSYALEDFKNLKSVTIPSSVTSIGSNAFKNCSSLTIIYIPESVTTISASSYSDSPFYGCSSDLVIYCEATSKQSGWGSYWNYRASGATLSVRYGWTKAVYEFFNDLNSDIEELVIPDTITSIPSYALEDFKNLKSVTIPSSVSSIGSNAFKNCSSLTDVYYGGTTTQWNALGSNRPSASYVHYFCAGSIGHWEAIEVATTCETDGYTADRCACGYERNIVIREEAWGHTEAIDKAVDPNCTETGLTEGKHCSVCSKVLVEQTVVDAMGHHTTSDKANKNAYTFNNSSTYPFILDDGWYESTNKSHNSLSTFQIDAHHDCTLVLLYKVSSESGYDKLSISVNNTEKDTISGSVSEKTLTLSLKTGDIVYIKYSKDGSQSNGADAGYFKIQSCVLVNPQRVPTDDVEPTCVDSVICDDCGQVVKEMLGHAEEVDAYLDPTCTETGLTEGSHCSRCGEILIPQTEIEALGHDYIDSICTVCAHHEGYEYTITDDQVTITGYTPPEGFSGELLIPETIKGLPVSAIGSSAFASNRDLLVVVIPNGVTRIGSQAFYNCSSLMKVFIPASVTNIASEAFWGCCSLRDLYFHHTATDTLSFGSDTFYAYNADYDYFPLTIHVPTVRNIHSTIASSNYRYFTVTYDYTGDIPVTAITLTEANNTTMVEAGLELNFTAALNPFDCTSELVWTATKGGVVKETDYVSATATIIGVNIGTMTVRCESADDNSIFAEYEVEILPPTADVASITVRTDTPYTNEVEVGMQAQMIADIYPGNAAIKDVVWELENGTGTAELDENGLLTALTTGTVTVYATATDGTEMMGSAIINIVRYVDDMTLLFNGDSTRTTIGVGEPVIVTLEHFPEDATNKSVTWTLTDGSGSIINVRSSNTGSNYYGDYDGAYILIQGETAGTATLTVTTKDSKKTAVSVELEVVGEEASCAVTGGNIYYNTVTGVIVGADGSVTAANIPARINGTTITSIAPDAFANYRYGYYNDNTTLTSVTIPSTVTYIGDNAFRNCTALASLRLGSGVTTIGKNAFYLCSSLANLTIPDSVTNVGNDAFYGLSSLKYLTMPGELLLVDGLNNYTALETATFTGKTIVSQPHKELEEHIELTTVPGRNAKQIIISDTVTTIEAFAFASRGYIENVTIGSGVTSIGERAFASCDSLVTVTGGENVTSIGTAAFKYCSDLTSINFSDPLTYIGEAAFSDCYNLTTINLPDSLTYIGKGAFYDCYNLQLFDLIGIPDTITQQNFPLTADLAGIPDVLISATGGKVDLYWYTDDYTEDGHGWAWINWDSQDNMYLGIGEPGKVKLVCCDEYTGARVSKIVNCELGLEIDGLYSNYLTAGQSVILTAYRADTNAEESVTWSLRSEDKAYASLSATSGKSTKLTAKAVTKATQIQITAKSSNPNEAPETRTVWILPAASGVIITDADGNILGKTGTTVQTLKVDMRETGSIQLFATVYPEGASSDVWWNSSNYSVADPWPQEGHVGEFDYQNPLVTLLGTGTATLTALANDGSGKYATVKLEVYYLDPATKFTAKTTAPTTGLEDNSTAQIQIFGTDKNIPLDPTAFDYVVKAGQEEMAFVDENGCITAGRKAGTVTVTATAKNDPKARKVTVNVKIIPAQTATIQLTATAENSNWIHMLDASGERTDDPTQAVKYRVYLDKNDVLAGKATFQIKPVVTDTNGNPAKLTKSSLKWTSTDTRVASAVANADGSATVTIPAKTDGACVITATSTDLAKVEGLLEVFVRDYTPRLESTTLTLNSNLIAGVSTGLTPGYDNEILGVELYDPATTLQSQLFTPTYEDGILTITPNSVLKNGSYKLIVKALCGDNYSYDQNVTVKVANKLPAVTVKQLSKFNLFYSDSTADLRITVKDEKVTAAMMEVNETSSFKSCGFNSTSGVMTVVYDPDYVAGTTGKLVTKVNLRITLDGYREPITKAISIATVTTKPTVTLTPASSIINTATVSSHSATIQAYNKTTGTYVPISPEDVTATFATVSSIGGGVKLTLKEGAKGGSATILVRDTNWMQPINLTHKVTVQTALPVMNLSAATMKLNRIFTEQSATADITLNQQNMAIGSISIEPADKTEKLLTESKKINVSISGNTITAKLDKENLPANGNYSYRVLVTLADGTQLAAKTFKVNVNSTVPTVKLKTATLKLNKVLGTEYATAESEFVLTKGDGYEIAGFALPSGWSNQDISVEYRDGMVFARLLRSEAAALKHTVALTPILRHIATGEESELPTTVKLTVQVESKTPTVNVTAAGKLDATLPGSAITYTIKSFTNVSGTPSTVALEGTHGELFNAVLGTSGTNVTLKMRDDLKYDLKTTYKVDLVFSICGQQVRKSVSFKISQSSLKFAAVKTLNLYQFQNQSVSTTITITAPAGASIDQIAMSSKTALQFRRALGNGSMKVTPINGGSSALVSFTLENPGYLSFGKSYTIYLDLFPESTADTVKATQVKLTVKSHK